MHRQTFRQNDTLQCPRILIFCCTACPIKAIENISYVFQMLLFTEVMQTGVSGSGVKVVMEMMGAVRPKANSHDTRHVAHAFVLVHTILA